MASNDVEQQTASSGVLGTVRSGPDAHRRRPTGSSEVVDSGSESKARLARLGPREQSVGLLSLRIARRVWRVAAMFLTRHHASIVIALMAIPFVVGVGLSLASSGASFDQENSPGDRSDAGDPSTAFANLQRSTVDTSSEANASSYVKRANRMGAKFTKISHPQILSELRAKMPTNQTDGVTLIVACMSRSKHFLLFLPTWIKARGVTQIVAVDWTSSEDAASEMLAAFSNHGVPPSSIFIRAENQTSWIPSRAYNLAASFALGTKILKVDCDTKITPEFMNGLSMSPDRLYTGEGSLRGVWMADKEHFDKVGGYDARIVHYGYEDENLYERMMGNLNLERSYFDRDTLIYASFDEVNGSHAVLLPNVWINANKLVLDALAPWDAKMAAADAYEQWIPQNRSSIYHIFSETTATSDSALMMVSSDERHQILRNATHRVLHDIHHVPWDYVNQLRDSEVVDILRYLATHESKPPIVVLLSGHVADRIAGLVWGLSVGAYFRRPLLVSWMQGPATQAKINEIFDFALVNDAAADSGLDVVVSPLVEWKCRGTLAGCQKFDSAYRLVEEKSLEDISGLPNPNSAKIVMYRMGKSVRSNLLTSIVEKKIQIEAAKALVAGLTSGVQQTLRTDGQNVAPFPQVTGVIGFVRPEDVGGFLNTLAVPGLKMTQTTEGKQIYFVAAPDNAVSKALRRGIFGQQRSGELVLSCPATNPRVACTQAAVGAIFKLAQCGHIWPRGEVISGFLSRPGVGSALALHEIMKAV